MTGNLSLKLKKKSFPQPPTATPSWTTINCWKMKSNYRPLSRIYWSGPHQPVDHVAASGLRHPPARRRRFPGSARYPAQRHARSLRSVIHQSVFVCTTPSTISPHILTQLKMSDQIPGMHFLDYREQFGPELAARRKPALVPYHEAQHRCFSARNPGQRHDPAVAAASRTDRFSGAG